MVNERKKNGQNHVSATIRFYSTFFKSGCPSFSSFTLMIISIVSKRGSGLENDNKYIRKKMINIIEVIISVKDERDGQPLNNT